MERPSHKRARPNQADFIDIRAIRVGPVGDAAGQGTITLYRTISGEEYVRKTLQDSLNPRAVARMRKEIEALQELKHDHIIQLSSYDVSKGGVSYVTRYYPLGSLHALLEGYEVSTVDAVLFMRQLLDALGAAHDAGIIHRDIKPQNILMRDDMHVLLADFGLIYRADGHSTAPGTGTPGYIAPELLISGAKPTPTSDIWSLGIVFLNLLRKTADQPMLHNLLTKFLIPHMVAINPEDRLQDCREVEERIKEVEEAVLKFEKRKREELQAQEARLQQFRGFRGY